MDGNILSRTASVGEVPLISREDCYIGWSNLAGDDAIDADIDDFKIHNK